MSAVFLEREGFHNPRRVFRQDENEFWEWAAEEDYSSRGHGARWYGYLNGLQSPTEIEVENV